MPFRAAAISWPSGEGIEVATIDGTLDLVRASLGAAQAGSIFDGQEDGQTAILLMTGAGPVTFIQEDIAPGVVAVIADMKAQHSDIEAAIDQASGGALKPSWHPPRD